MALRVGAAFCMVLVAGCGNREPAAPASASRPAPGRVDGVRIASEEHQGSNWLTHGRTYDEQRFSPLEQIKEDNIAALKLAWHFDPETERGQEASPVVVDGVMYVSTAWSKVYALDAATGRQLWEFDPKSSGHAAVNGCCDIVNRGVAVWDGKVYVATFDGRLVAIDAATGREVWEQLTVDQTLPYTITGAPRIVKGVVLIGNAGGEMGKLRGYLSAYDSETGKLRWRFFTVPGDPSKGFENKAMEMAAGTWKGSWWKFGGGGLVWDSMAYDPQLDLLYFGVGSGFPWDQEIRSPGGGDNLFLSSIVAVRPDTGEYVWHYQTTPGETWDFDATQHLLLADLTINGQSRKVVMQAAKNGFFYVLDRANGGYISAQRYVDVNWATGIDSDTHRPIENPAARWGRFKEVFAGKPGPPGGHNWQPMAYSPKTGWVYVPVLDMGFPYLRSAVYDADLKQVYNAGSQLQAATLPVDPDARAQALETVSGRLMAWDPVTQREVWSVRYSGPWNGGVLATAGNLIFQGTQDGEIAAYAATGGAKVWSFRINTGIIAPPISYAVNGEQYIAVLAGMGGAYPLTAGDAARGTFPKPNIPRVLAFKLNGSDQLPVASRATATPTAELPPATAAQSVVVSGKVQYHMSCFHCHGIAAISGEIVPDLRYSAALSDPAAWNAIVAGGALEPHGMAAFGSVLTTAQIDSIRAYVIQRAHETIRDERKTSQ